MSNIEVVPGKFYETREGGLARATTTDCVYYDGHDIYTSPKLSKLGPSPLDLVDEVCEEYYRQNCKTDYKQNNFEDDINRMTNKFIRELAKELEVDYKSITIEDIITDCQIGN